MYNSGIDVSDKKRLGQGMKLLVPGTNYCTVQYEKELLNLVCFKLFTREKTARVNKTEDRYSLSS